MRFKIVAVGRNAGNLLEPCLLSIASQDFPRVDVCLIDDASSPEEQELVKVSAEAVGWQHVCNTQRMYATKNQQTAWQMLNPRDDDVIVFVDFDDRLAHSQVLSQLASYYERGAWMTYGSYRVEPVDHPSASTCRPAVRYPRRYVERNQFRRAPLYFNHLRSISWRVLKHLTDEDLQDRHHRYWRAITDQAVMIPCLELAGDRAVFVPEVLYVYTCDRDDAVWRSMNDLLHAEGRDLKSRPAKVRLPDVGRPMDPLLNRPTATDFFDQRRTRIAL